MIDDEIHDDLGLVKHVRKRVCSLKGLTPEAREDLVQRGCEFAFDVRAKLRPGQRLVVELDRRLPNKLRDYLREDRRVAAREILEDDQDAAGRPADEAALTPELVMIRANLAAHVRGPQDFGVPSIMGRMQDPPMPSAAVEATGKRDEAWAAASELLARDYAEAFERAIAALRANR